MGRINLLDIEVSNKIAAGEVVERPASVVKELVENSIDAGADKICVEIKNGGNTFIKVTDNGCGMEKEDAAVAFLRHATSKISTEEDLNAIYTLGFRGEALSSIGAVAKVDLYTKRREDSCGIHTVCEGGEIISEEDAGIPDGTVFVVSNLFYNVPARMKFLKKDSTEAGYISDIMTRFILSHPEISFKLINNGKQVLSSYGDGKLTNCVYSVYGRDYAASMIDVEFETEYVKVSGLCGKGSTARANRSYQSFFINGRYIKSPLIMRAVEEAYKNQIMIGKFPAAVLNIEMNPSLADINVHPTKLEVKFSNENEVYQAVYHAVKEALYRIADIPEIKRAAAKKEEVKTSFTADKIISDGQMRLDITENNTLPIQKKTDVAAAETLGADKKTENSLKETAAEKKAADLLKTVPADVKEEIKKEVPQLKKESIPPLYAEEKTNKIAQPKMFDYNGDLLKNQVKEQNADKEKQEKEPEKKEQDTPEKVYDDKIINTEKTDTESVVQPQTEEKKDIDFRLVGQLFDTYIIIEVGDEMRIIDQHAAHERLKYEELRKEAEGREVYSQGLAIPVVVRLTSIEAAVFEQNAEFICSLGFDAENYGENTVIIRSVPTGMIEDDIGELFIEIIQQLDDNKREIITEKKERLLYTMACKAAIKANHRLDEREQKELVKMVLALNNINTCPHGRPIVISMSKKEIEKNFKRIV